MGQLLNRPISVHTVCAWPRRVFFNGKWHNVFRVMEVWKDVGCWWTKETEKTFFRLQLEAQHVIEIYWAQETNFWVLYRIYD